MGQEAQDLSSNFRSFACNHCGWCCKRAPCSLAILMDAPLKGPCPYLEFNQEGQSLCGLMKTQTSSIKRMAISQLILSDQGCTHRFGPHPVSLMKELIGKGLEVGSAQWQYIVRETLKEMLEFKQQSLDPHSIQEAIDEFSLFVGS
jgi:hypothetical protein